MKIIKHEQHGYSQWRIGVTSGCGEWPGCRLTIGIPNHTWRIRLPRIIKPVLYWEDLSHYVGQPGWEHLKPDANGRYGYQEVFAREYSVSYLDRNIHVHYGQQTMEWGRGSKKASKSRCFGVPWLEFRFFRQSYYDLAGNWIADESRRPTKGGWREIMGERERIIATQPKAYFDFADYDGERIKVSCRIEEREWRRGIGWFRWLSWFCAPTIRRSLDLEFSSEVGRMKGSWKGGTLGHGTEMQPGDTVEAAFRRYCEQQKLTFIGACEPWDRRARESSDAALSRTEEEK